MFVLVCSFSSDIAHFVFCPVGTYNNKNMQASSQQQWQCACYHAAPPSPMQHLQQHITFHSTWKTHPTQSPFKLSLALPTLPVLHWQQQPIEHQEHYHIVRDLFCFLVQYQQEQWAWEEWWDPNQPKETLCKWQTTNGITGRTLELNWQWLIVICTNLNADRSITRWKTSKKVFSSTCLCFGTWHCFNSTSVCFTAMDVPQQKGEILERHTSQSEVYDSLIIG